jgi:hypothetical protein
MEFLVLVKRTRRDENTKLCRGFWNCVHNKIYSSGFWNCVQNKNYLSGFWNSLLRMEYGKCFWEVSSQYKTLGQVNKKSGDSHFWMGLMSAKDRFLSLDSTTNSINTFSMPPRACAIMVRLTRIYGSADTSHHVADLTGEMWLLLRAKSMSMLVDINLLLFRSVSVGKCHHTFIKTGNLRTVSHSVTVLTHISSHDTSPPLSS